MGIHPVASAASPTATSPVESKPSFGKLLQEARQRPEVGTPGSVIAPAGPSHAQPGQAHAVRPNLRVDAHRSAEATAARALERVSEAQRRLDRVLALAGSGKTFTPAELLGLQAQVYSASQELDLAGKVVEKATSGVKQVLQTQL